MTQTWYYSFWELIVQWGILFTALLVGNTLRRKVPIINKSLLPSAVLGGIIILLLKLIPQVNSFINSPLMESMTYHCLALGFVALTLKEGKKQKDRKAMVTVVKTGATVVSTYLLQGVFGLIVTILLSLAMTEVIPATGLLMMLGFGQGPGQAYNFGSVFEGYGLNGGRSFGLAIASIGFLVACIVGVIWLNILRKKGKLRDVSGKDGNSHQISQDVPNPNDIPLSESVDKLTMNVAIVVATYFLCYLFMWGVTYFLDKGYLGNFGINTVKPLIWGFNFLFGVLFALIVKACMKGLKKAKIMTHNYTNNYMLNRISGFVFDLMILSGIAAIDFEKLKGLWIPLVLLTIVGTVVTMIYLNFICKRLYPDYRYESLASLFGMLTGTASTGVILLREVDPLFETPASDNLVLQTVPAMVFGFPLLLLVGFAPQGMTQSLIVLGAAVVMFVVFNIFILFKKKPKIQKDCAFVAETASTDSDEK
ncbi:MAG: hypothetical protein IJA88_03860 [Clostridia bacterium]|nr:hypothetical protein [Clostridia bacterium]